MHGGAIAVRCAPQCDLRQQPQSQFGAQRKPAECFAPRAVSAAHRRAPVERAGRAPALARAVDLRGGALTVMDDRASGWVEPTLDAGGGCTKTEVDVLSVHVESRVERAERRKGRR